MKKVMMFGKIETTQMSIQEFVKWIKGKKVYHRQCGWLELWKNKIYNEGAKSFYFPGSGFVLRGNVKLAKYQSQGYEGCFSYYTLSGKDIWELDIWSVSFNSRNKIVTIRKGKKK